MVRKYLLKIVVVLSLLCTHACSFLEQSPESYVAYFEDKENGLRKELIIGNVLYDIQFKTPEYIVCKEGLEGEAKAERLERLKNTIWFNIAVSSSMQKKSLLAKDSLTKDLDVLSYFLMSAENNFSLRFGSAQPEKIAYYFQNNQNFVPYDVLILGYKGNYNKNKKIELTYKDKLFNQGDLRIEIDQQSLNKIPKLKG